MEKQKKYSWHGPKQIWMIFFTGIMMLFSACLVGGSTNTVLPAISELRGWDNQLLNLVAGAAAMLDGIGILIWAKISRRNAKLLTAISLFITAVCLIVFGWTTSLVLFIVIIIIMALMSAAYSSTCAMTLTANWWPTKKGVVLGFSTMGIVLMSVVYVPLIPKAYAAIGIPMTQVALAILVAIFGVVTLVAVKDTPEEAGETPDGVPPLEAEETKKIIKMMAEYESPFTLGKLAKDYSSWTMALAPGLGLMAAMSFIASTIPTLLMYGYDFGFASLVFAVGGIAALGGSFVFGIIDQKWGTKNATTLYIICMLVAIFCCFGMKSNPIFVWIAAIVLMAANGAGRNLLPSFVATKYGRWDYPAAYKLIGTVGLVCCAGGIFITGIFANPTTMYIFDVIILVIALICARVTNDKFIGKAD